MADQDKTLTVTNMDQLATQVPDVVVHGDPGAWVCIGKVLAPDHGFNSERSQRAENGGRP